MAGEAEVQAAMKRERERYLSLSLIARETNCEDRLSDWNMRGVSPEVARREALERNHYREQARGALTMSDRERSEYNLPAALLARATGSRASGLAEDISAQIASDEGKDPGRFYLPLTTRTFSVQTRASVTGQVVGTASLGGSAVQTSVMSFIEMLKNNMVMRAAGIQVIEGLRDNLSFPRQATANTFTWVGENPSSANSLSALTFDTVAMSPKVGMVSTSYSRLMGIQNSDIQSLVIQDIAQQAALGADLAVLHGSGTGQPRGVFNTSCVNTVTFGSGQGAVPTFAKLVDFQTRLIEDNAPMARPAYVTTPGIRGALMQTLKSTTAGSAYIWEDERLAGLPAFQTAQVRSDFTTGTSTACHGVVLADWSEVILGFWGNSAEIQVNPYLYSHQNVVAVDCYLNCDVGIRHPVAVAVSTDALAA